MKYTVKYKNGLLWRTLRNIIGDGFIESRDLRFFIFEDGTVIEIPSNNTIFVFSKEREQVIQENNKNNS